MGLTLLIPVGALMGWAYDRWSDRQSHPEFAKRMGVLAATGLVVGESLFGVVFAGLVGATGNDAPLGVVGDNFASVAMIAAPVVFVALIAQLYRHTSRVATG